MNACPRCGAPTKPLNSNQMVCEYCGETIFTMNTETSENYKILYYGNKINYG